VGPCVEEGDPLVQYKVHALGSNETFLLAGKIVASVVAAMSRGVSEEDAFSHWLCFHAPLSWWEVVGGSDTDHTDAMEQEITASHSLLVEGLVSRGAPRDSSALRLEFYSGLLAAFELNSMSIQVDSPLLATADKLNKLTGEAKAATTKLMQKKAGQALKLKAAYADDQGGAAIDTESSLGTLREMARLGGKLFEPLEGSGMFSLVCTMNHSCAPNCLVAYDTTDPAKVGGPAEASVFAMKPIDVDEELTIAYVDTKLPLKERREALRHYGFECRCPKCRFEEGRTALSIETLHELGSAAAMDERYQDAVEIYSELLKMSQVDGDAHEGLGKAYLNIGLWAKGGKAFAKGLKLCPTHDGLVNHAKEREAYYGGQRSRAAAQYSEWEVRKASLGRDVFETRGIFTKDECRDAVKLAEEHAEGEGGWTTARHYSVPTTDIPIHAVPPLLVWFNQALEERLLPMLASQYPDAILDRVRVHDAFLVKYDAEAQKELPVHCDQSEWSFTISLNESGEYEGGGTWFEDLEETLRPEVGGVVSFPGALFHAGAAITSGRRYIIAAFMYLAEVEEEEKDIPSRQGWGTGHDSSQDTESSDDSDEVDRMCAELMPIRDRRGR